MPWETPQQRPAQTRSVAKSGGDYASLSAALAAITNASSTNPYAILVHPGRFTEPPITLKEYVDVIALGGLFDTILIAQDNTQHFIHGAPHCELKGLSIDGPTSVGCAAVDYQGTGTAPFILRCAIRKGYYGLWVHPASYGVVHALQTVNYYAGSHMEQFLRVTDAGALMAEESAFMSGPPGAVTTGFYADGPNVVMTLDTCQFSNAGSTYGLFADNGAQVRVTGGSFKKGTNAIRVGPNGSGTLVDAAGGITIASENFTEDIGIDSATGKVYGFGRADLSQMRETAANSIRGCFIDPATNKVTVVGRMNLRSAAGSTAVAEFLTSIGAPVDDATEGSLALRADAPGGAYLKRNNAWVDALDVTAAGIYVGTSAPGSPTTRAQWLTDRIGYWGFIDIS